MSREEVLNEIIKLCKDNDLRYYVQIDDGKTISGAWSYVNGTKLEKIAIAANAHCDEIKEVIE